MNSFDINLPEKPSDLLLLALHDLELCENDPLYAITINKWTANHSRLRVVNFSGVVKAQTLKTLFRPSGFEYRWIRFSAYNTARLNALDHFSVGLLRLGLEDLGLKGHASRANNREVHSYGGFPRKFKLDMQQLAWDFQRVSL